MDATGTTPSKQSRRRWMGTLQIACVLVLVAAALLYSRPPRPDAGQAQNLAPSGADLRPLVSVMRPVPTRTRIAIDATGTVRVRSYVDLSLLVGGRVASVSPALRTGGAFAAGQQLLALDSRDFDLAIEQARADADAARAALRLQQAESSAAKANYALLHPGAPVPELVARAPQIAQARARIAAADAQLARAELERRRTRFALPFAGRIAAAGVAAGQVLARGQTFGRAFADDAVEVAVPIAAEDLARLAPAIGRAATVHDGARAFAATVERIAPERDARTRFAELYLAFADRASADGAPPPPPGAFVDVELHDPAVDGAFLLPAAAAQPGGSVYLVADGVLQRFAPRTLSQSADGWLVAAFDVKDGVVIGSVPGAADGLAVDIAGAMRERLGE